MREERKRDSTATLINLSLVGVAAAAWLSQRFPSYSPPILALVLIFGISVSAFLLLRNSSRGAIETKAAVAPEHLPPLNAAYDAMMLDTYRATREAVENFYRHSRQLRVMTFPDNVVVGCKGATDWRRTAPFLNLTPPTENYSVRVGIVTITVKDGNTDIQIGSSRDTLPAQGRRKIEMQLAEDAGQGSVH